MECGCDKKESKAFPSAVVEINNPEQIVLLRKVVIPATLGDDTVVEPVVGKYKNVILYYEANKHAYIYSSDGIPTYLETEIPQELLDRVAALEDGLGAETTARENADTALGTRITDLDNSLATVAKTGSYTDLLNKPNPYVLPAATSSTLGGIKTVNSFGLEMSNNDELKARVYGSSDYSQMWNDAFVSKGTLDYALSTKLNKNVMTDISLNANTSTTTVQIDGAKENLYTGATSTKNITLPVASTTQAGVMNSSTFDAITANTNNLNAIMNGAVAITGIAASPSQSDLTTTWLTETGLTALINRASIYDVSNDKVWTYYVNDATWHVASNTSHVTINTFTNSSEGTILGSTNVGQIFAENDGTGSVNGWDTLSNAVSTNTSDIAALQSAIPTVNDATLTIQNNGTNVATFTANSATNTTANIVPPVQIGSVLSTPSSVEYVNTANIADGAVTTTKLAQGAARDEALNINLGANVDLDTIVESGFYRFYAPYTNSPVDSTANPYGSMLVISYSDDYRCTQIFIPNSDGNASVFVRNSYLLGADPSTHTRAWSHWKTVAGGNDGVISLPGGAFASIGANYTFDFGYAYLKANTLFLNFAVHKNSGTIGSDEMIAQLQTWAAPTHEIFGASFLSSGSAFTTQTVGYLYINGKDSATPANAGQIIVSDPSNSSTYAKVCIWFPL